MKKYKDFQQAYLSLLNTLITHPDYQNTPRGSLNWEVINANFAISNPRQRICFIPERKTNIIYNFAESLWYLSGSNSLDFIKYYCKNMEKYSVDGKVLTGSAYGPKMFSYGKSKINQWNRILKLLQEDDPFSNRAILQIYDPKETLEKENIDVTCTLALQFFLREGQLHLSTYMRSNDCYRGMVSDIFCFTFLQEFLACQLGAELGDYYHNVGSLHLYQREYLKAKKTLQSKEYENNNPKCLTMPQGNNWPYVHILLEYEKAFRTNTKIMSKQLLIELDLPYYWEQILILLGIYQQIVYKKTIEISWFNRVDPSYKPLIFNRWKNLLKDNREELEPCIYEHSF